MLKFSLKRLICISFIFTFSQASLQASSKIEQLTEKQIHYRLKQLHQKKLNLDELQAGIETLTQQGFPLKRAREIYAQEQKAKVFAKKYKSELLPVSKVLEKIGGTSVTELYKTDEGVLDDIFTTPDIEWLKRGNAPLSIMKPIL